MLRCRCSKSEHRRELLEKWIAVWGWATGVGDFHCGVILTRLLDVRESEGSEDEDYWIEEVGEL